MALLLPYISALLAMFIYVPCSAGQTVMTVEPITPLKTCQPITLAIPTCINVGWCNTSFPNLRSHQTQAEAYEELEDFDPLIRARCSNKIVHFLCAIYAPACLYTGSSSPGAIVVKPCRSLCEYVRNDCEPVLNNVGHTWPAHLNCDNFPYTSDCLDADDDIDIPMMIPRLVIIPSPPRSPTSSVPALSPSLRPSVRINNFCD